MPFVQCLDNISKPVNIASQHSIPLSNSRMFRPEPTPNWRVPRPQAPTERPASTPAPGQPTPATAAQQTSSTEVFQQPAEVPEQHVPQQERSQNTAEVGGSADAIKEPTVDQAKDGAASTDVTDAPSRYASVATYPAPVSRFFSIFHEQLGLTW